MPTPPRPRSSESRIPSIDAFISRIAFRSIVASSTSQESIGAATTSPSTASSAFLSHAATDSARMIKATRRMVPPR
jgi:hypothetical protein